MPSLLCYPAIEPERFDRLAIAVPDWQLIQASDESQAITRVELVDAFFGRLTPAILAASKRLRWVQTPTASLEHYLFRELVEHDCQLTNMRGLFSDVIADQVMGYVLCFARNLHIYLRQQAAHRWDPVGGESQRSDLRHGPARVTEIDRRHRQLAGQTLGIIGLGEIGREVARRAAAFGLKRIAVEPQATTSREAVESQLVEEVLPIEQLNGLLERSDFVVVAAPQTPVTVGMIQRPQLERMKSTAILINIGRGPLVGLDDLVDALNEGVIAGAALDVFEIEPLPATHPLWDCPNAIITPHVAGYATCVPERHFALLVENLDRFAQGKNLCNLVDKRLGY